MKGGIMDSKQKSEEIRSWFSAVIAAGVSVATVAFSHPKEAAAFATKVSKFIKKRV